MKYTQLSDQQVAHMLATIGVDSIDALFKPVSSALRESLGDTGLNLPKGLSEPELLRDVHAMAARNRTCDDLVCFLGGGAYDHFIPTIVDALAGQSEFLTAYTPYQAEASQGILQLFYEFQTMICELTGMEVANASLYEGASAAAEAMIMATGITRRSRVLAAANLHPDTLKVLHTYGSERAIEVDTLGVCGGGVDETALADALDDRTAAVVVQSPNFLGCMERLDRIVPRIQACGALAVVSTDPLASGVFKSPGAFGADLVVGEGQGLGIPLQYGGPYLGLLAARSKYMRKMPGRIVGMTTDLRGRRAFCLTLQTREQHIKRERATSNVCTNQGLLAVRAAAYMAAMGKSGIAAVASQCFDKAHYAADSITGLDGYSLAFDAPFFKEFAVRTTRGVDRVLKTCRQQGVLAGVPMERFDDQYDDCFLVAVTEKRTRAEIDRLVALLDSVEKNATPSAKPRPAAKRHTVP